MNKKIIMLLSNAFLPDPRPYAQARSLVKAGNRVTILCWDRGEGLAKNEAIDGILVERIHFFSKHGRGSAQIIFLGLVWLGMLWRLLKSRPDIVYCHDFDTFIPGLFMKIFKKKIIFDSHEVYSRMLGQNVSGLLIVFVGWMEKKFVKKADLVITTCRQMSDLYRSYGARNIAIVGNWKRLDEFQISQDICLEERKTLGIKNELVISYIANLGPERMIMPLLEVVKDDPELFLIIGGRGPQERLIKEKAESSKNIRYLGLVPYEKVPLYTSVADIIYYGYDKKAGMAEFASPNKLFEALAAGKAFLGGNFGEMGLITKEEKCGIALEEFDKESIKSALRTFKNHEELSRFKENAKSCAIKKYNWEIAEKNLLEAISKTINAG